MKWNDWVEEIGPPLLRYFSADGWHRSTAADGVQETLLRLYRKVQEGKFEPAQGTLRMYAFGIARLVRLELIRERGEFDLFETPPETPVAHPSDDADARQRVQLRSAIRELEEPAREILLLLVDQELKLEEIARILNMPLGTVKSHIHRAKEKLKARLNDRSEVSS